MIRRKVILAAISALSVGALSSRAGAIVGVHVTDGAFGPGEWSASPTTPVQPFAFDPVSNRGGAVLYVEQSTNGAGKQTSLGTTLNLMYDYVASPTTLGAGSNNTNSSVDIFFEVPNDADYAVHITGTGFIAVEKPNGATSPENGDGTLHFLDPSNNPIAPWTALTPADLTLADFHTALGFGASPNSAASHLIAEFDLTIDGTGSPAGGGHGGIYDPAPAFWSASGKSGTADPVFSSEEFTLGFDGTTGAQPAVNSAGLPVAQPADLPEPASMTLLAAGGAALLVRRRRGPASK